MWKVVLTALCFLTVTMPVAAGTRIAIVTSESSPENDQMIALAEANLGSDTELELLDRQAILKVLAEQKLALSGLVDPEQAIKAGKLLNVDLFALLECAPENATIDATKTKKRILGLTALDSRSGVRLWDATLPQGETEETAHQIAAGVQAAVTKYRQQGNGLRTVGLLTVRNADLPRSQDPTIQMIGRLLERQLVRSPDVAVVERERLRVVLQERSLPAAERTGPLLASLRLLELEIGRDRDQGLLARIRVSDGAGQEIALLKTTAADPATLAARLLPEVLQTLNVAKTGAPLDSAREADRYYLESWMSWQHKEYERAATAAEAVHALDPDNNARLQWLISRLAEAAIELVDPGQQNYAGPPKKPIPAAELERSIDLVRHGLNLFRLYLQRVLRNPDWFRDQNGLSLMFYHTYFAKIVALDDKATPHSREIVRELVDEYRELQFHTYGRELYEAAKSGRAFREYTGWVASGALLDIMHRFSKVRDDWPSDVAEILTNWSELADAQHPSQDKQLLRSCDYVLMTVRYSLHIPPLDEQRAQPLREAFRILKSRSDPILQLNGRLLEIYLDKELQKLPEARQLVPQLVADVEPYAIAPDGPTQDVQTRRRWIDMVLTANAVLDRTDRVQANRKFYDLLQSHGIYSPFVFHETAGYYQGQKLDRERLELLSHAIAFLEKQPLGMTSDELRTEIGKLRESHRLLSESLGLVSVAVAPWESAATLIDVAEATTGIRSIVRPVVAERTAHALGMSWDPPARQVAFSLLRFNLDSRDRNQLATWTLDNLEPAKFEQRTRLEDGEINQLTTIERSTSEGSYFIRSACIAGDHYFAATMGRGIVAFPLQGGDIRRLDESIGLPSDFVHCLIAHDGFLYAWLGQPRKAAYLVRLKPDGTEIQTIASSRRTIRETPLDNVTPALCDFMTIDEPRHRLVFRLANSGSDNVLGIWELSLKTNVIRQLKRTHLILSGYAPRLLTDERVLIKDGFVARIFDLKTNELTQLAQYQAENPGLFMPIGVLGDRIWLSYPFGSFDVKTKSVETFPKLRAADKMFQPGVFFAQTGDREYLLADPGALWILKLK
ncbi:MAG: hypothetical protein JSS02_04665 [Planctomycetes bacterium]|nr:hypothetical protein [Planctomycetota bacterium]